MTLSFFIRKPCGFFRAGLIEAWGSGTLRMIDDCRKDNTPIPVFNYDFSGFLVNFSFKKFGVNEPVNEPANEPVNKDTLSERIIALIQKTPNITRIEIGKQLLISESTVKRQIKILKQTNKLIRTGSDKSGVWTILENE